MSTNDLVGRRYVLGLLDRRIAQRVDNVSQAFADITGDRGTVALRCACGRCGCTEVLTVPLVEYDGVRSARHRFVVAPGHATDVDTLVRSCDGYDVVELKPEHRQGT